MRFHMCNAGEDFESQFKAKRFRDMVTNLFPPPGSAWAPNYVVKHRILGQGWVDGSLGKQSYGAGKI